MYQNGIVGTVLHMSLCWFDVRMLFVFKYRLCSHPVARRSNPPPEPMPVPRPKMCVDEHWPHFTGRTKPYYSTIHADRERKKERELVCVYIYIYEYIIACCGPRLVESETSPASSIVSFDTLG